MRCCSTGCHGWTGRRPSTTRSPKRFAVAEFEVLYLSTLLIETLADPTARAKAIQDLASDIRLGETLRTTFWVISLILVRKTWRDHDGWPPQ